MPQEIVRARKNGREYNTGRAQAERDGAEILEDESPFDRGGAPRPMTRVKGRPVKPKVSVAEAAEKKAAKSADQSDTAPSNKE